MTSRFSLKSRVYLTNALLLFITLIGAALMIWYTYKTEKIFKEIIDKNIVIYQSVEALSTSLVNQKGFVSYYLIDRDPIWLEKLNSYRKRFAEQLTTVKSLIKTDWEKTALSQIEQEYKIYLKTKDRVIEFYKSGEIKAGSELHRGVRDRFFKILDLCEQFKTVHKNEISLAIQTSQKESNHLRFITMIAVATVIQLSLLINYIFAHHIFKPIRRLAKEVDRRGEVLPTANELAALTRSVHGLIENANQTHEELRKSRETLMQSEKMALLGKLAAGTAHSIRNPLTSVKMRLFSLNRSCRLTPGQQDDFNVISDEIKQINKIVENFLEFARPPRLCMSLLSPSDVVDNTLRLLNQRLQSYHVTTRVIRQHPLPETLIDPELLKEVVANIIINACEAMDRNGSITIHEEKDHIEPLKWVDVIRIIDDGPGIPANIIDQIFDPFFTTKEEGTGLGLSIAFNIINEHGGWLDVSSQEGRGASFAITLPVKDS